MTHPTREDWMSYLYDEVTPESRATMRAHLLSCAACREQVQTWQDATRSLDGFRLPARRAVSPNRALTRWAIAAAFVAFAALGLMRVLALQGEVKQMRAELHNSFRREIAAAVRLEVGARMREDLNAALAELSAQAAKGGTVEAQALVAAMTERLETRRLADQQATLAALQKLSARHTQDYAELRKELETVAVLTEAGLQRAQNQIATLAYSPVADSKQH